MRTFTIEATSAESALGFVSALSGFDAAMIRTVHGTNLVRVTINGDIHKAVRLLDTLDVGEERGRDPAKDGVLLLIRWRRVGGRWNRDARLVRGSLARARVAESPRLGERPG